MPYKDREKQRAAQREYAKRVYQHKKETRQEIRLQRREFIRDLKRNPCVDCKGSFSPVCMDFDHVRGEKITSLSTMSNQCYSIADIEKEIAKCDLVCANCHRIRTAEREGWNDAGSSNGKTTDFESVYRGSNP